MKHVFSTTLLPILTQSDIRNLCIEVKETLVNHTNESKAKKFTSAELWNIHKQRRDFGKRQFLRNY